MSATTIAILDYEMGNRRSVEKAFAMVGADASITPDHDLILNADGAVIVGVGAFPEAMRRLQDRGMVEVLRERVKLGRPILGICLGLQIFFERSEEHDGADGLGFLEGTVRELPSNGHKVPHIGWNQVQWRPGSRLRDGVEEEDSVFYHLHSFAAYDAGEGDDFFSRPEVAGKTTYSCAFVTAVEEHPLYGVQFHPEKSSRQGLQLLRNFVDICGEPKRTLL
jgi:imidazole glycerol-phosphate synthase subunit HisH